LRLKIVPLLVVAAALALLLPAASADVCIGPCGFQGGTGGGGAGAGGTSGPFFNISNAVDGGEFQAPNGGGKTQSGIVTEGDVCEFTVHRTGGYKHAATVHYYTKDGTAESPLDYEGISKSGDTPSANFEPDQHDATINIGTNRYPEEGEPEGESPSTIETFTVHLTDAHGAKIGDGKGVCKIGEGPGDFEQIG
jgi:hypothetical protein